MSDVIQKTTKYRIKQIELAEAKYYKSLITVLDRIETQVTALASRDLPIQDGKLIELQSAIAIRPKIKQILDTEYLPLADQIVRDGFNEQANGSHSLKMYQIHLQEDYQKRFIKIR
jgi:hypothetical protein